MTLSLIVSMSLFSLAASLSPGPVNLVGIGSGARYGAFIGLRFVTGATVGFIVLFVSVGLSLQYMVAFLPMITPVLQWGGVIFLLHLSYQLFRDNGEINIKDATNVPSFMTGAYMQWLNPKAWLASLAGIVSYIPEADGQSLVIFSSVYFVICWLSLSVWVMAGVILGRFIEETNTMKRLNKVLAILLAGSCVFIIV
ncbi:LysE family translocator [Marinomonas sp. 15G1-11]|uniref:LysE family translocator n=1 Tax=Marinomonas phaeophyticola TaxID=3004091 RepID=A0ABT4JUU1_9GAMM|nr:LysE family translocator [Marinomonas sp. 15G1-11]MCZ2722011.1 LysE family translocator [Marinomonas sp. 15G1-11]